MEHIGQEVEFPALGRTWRAARCTRRTVWKPVTAWARTMLPDPLAIALKHIDRASELDETIMRRIQAADIEEAKKAKAANRQPSLLLKRYKPIADVMIEKAQEQAALLQCVASGSRAVNSVMDSLEGQTKILFHLLRPNHPDITEETADEILDEIGTPGYLEILLTTQGKRPAPKNDDAPAPSAGEDAGRPTGT